MEMKGKKNIHHEGGCLAVLKKRVLLVLSVFFFSYLFFSMGVLAEEEGIMKGEIGPTPASGETSGEGALANPEPTLVEKVQQYVAEQIDPDLFAGVHIDWVDEKPVIVLSVTQSLDQKQEKELMALAEKEQLKIRIVDYSEKELMQKQQEIDVNAFEDQGVKIWYTGINVWTNRVEVGIEPFNEETAELVYDKYGRDMITVVEGHEAIPLAGDLPVSSNDEAVTSSSSDQNLPSSQTVATADGREPAPLEEGTPPTEQTPIFQRIWQTIFSWFKGIFS